ncbi:uncharacterized protein LOC118278959 isoform X4 [Spodoptera frugiperda]|uniref:Uncharacterized protein LOC118278959 isoform X4 n=1 Tax=Spodoptera frugiperda TaxID=7108 RepID=A0A9R0E6M0_SPOFR|nr:uncharacterized protein LOC118278959 isoform X4 [Spodoptera frugiperda]XP_050559658.1 uncharacterized protein LOC118278959 isoform X4 [Spodoptera frugiperda]XP_050559659.1 uncharacterized protein LOC118278959 isoform X4 [Spodoptera frugiperda]XP_050559660.1 uncharacterized protein LOC118278959 isoform X4 [Spodoptera frugiperda]
MGNKKNKRRAIKRSYWIKHKHMMEVVNKKKQLASISSADEPSEKTFNELEKASELESPGTSLSIATVVTPGANSKSDYDEEEKREELLRKRNRVPQRTYNQRQKILKKNEEKKKKKVPKTNSERQKEYRRRKAEKSNVDIKRRSNEDNVVQGRVVENKRDLHYLNYPIRDKRDLKKKSSTSKRESSLKTIPKTRAAAARRKNGKVVCPECNTDVDVEGRQGDKATAMLVNVYQYFATEGTKLSPSQLRERTALCTGASEEDVEHALGLYWSQTGDSDSQEAPSRKRRRVEEQPGDESHPLYVEVEVEAAEDEENGEEDPLTSEEEDIKPDITETCIQPVSQSSYIPVEDIKKETTEFEDGVS